MLPLIYLRKLIYQLPYLLLDGYMKLSNHLTFRVHRISNVLLTSFCYYCRNSAMYLPSNCAVGGALLKNHGVFFGAIQNSYHSIQILIRYWINYLQFYIPISLSYWVWKPCIYMFSEYGNTVQHVLVIRIKGYVAVFANP